MLSWLFWILGVLVAAVAALAGLAYFLFGGGLPYGDLSTEPVFPQGTLEVVVTSDRPIGNAAVSADGRVFYTIHPESRPVGPKLYEWRDGAAIPYPSEAQATALETPLGLVVDTQNRLWVIDPGNHGMGAPRLIAYDLSDGSVVHDYAFDPSIAPRGSFLQDLQISADGRWIYIADVGYWMRRPALIVYDVEAERAWRVLNRHSTVMPRAYLIRNQIKDMAFFGGFLEMRTGVDGIALSPDDQFLYFGAMNHGVLHKVPTVALQNPQLSAIALAAEVTAVAAKPLSDGFSMDVDGTVYMTDIEHQAILSLDIEGVLRTVIKDTRIRWADGLSFGPDGWLYLADSAIPHVVLQDAAYHAQHAPYYVWRFRPGVVGRPGQ